MYGETSFELVDQMVKSIKFTADDYFIDLGSGKTQFFLAIIFVITIPNLVTLAYGKVGPE